MELVIPDGAQVYITIGNTPLLALPNETALQPAARKSGGRFLKGVVAGILILGAFQAGRVVSHRGDPIPPAQASFNERLPPALRGFSTAAKIGSTAHDCVRNALTEIANMPDSDLPARPAPPADGTPVTNLTPMLAMSSKHVFAGSEPMGLPNEPVDDRLLRGIAVIERASGVAETMPRGAGLSVLADRDEALAETVIVEPPSMSAEVLEMQIKVVIEHLGKLRSAANLKRAA